MKKMMLKASAAVLLLTQVVAGGIPAAAAEQPAPKVAAAAATAAPVMTDNLAKYGLKKDVELPVTVTAGGLSYTLEKIMIYETKSATAQALIKKYGYTGTEGQKYFIWTKITIKNSSNAKVQFSSKDLSDKWRFNFGEEAFTSMPRKFAEKVNNTEVLWTWELAPGKKLTSYQAYTYNDKLERFYITVDNKGQKNVVDVVKK
ncbi:hypothetical protein PSTEL_07000 [Paenibacillus stellifer]|uniref:DUF4352 domain-containing protein n=1 Tax=Paenibacillus stellifer TaxID=169760 RepID=A0A089LS46_9BACL|nr:hypothetical protein [Paenibacillus stellifer]AIQ62890.1 hypothetical protein PSTEL_07000 [Paenibacillus stellifer]